MKLSASWATLKAAERVSQILADRSIECAIIGGAALSVHGYVRATMDLDLATSVEPFGVLAPVAEPLVTAGFQVEFRTPDASDPLGGVLDIRRDDIELIQIVNFENPLGGGHALLGREAISTAQALPGTSLKVVTLVHLIALKLYAGGSQQDVFELLERHEEVIFREVDDICKRMQLTVEWEKVKSSFARGQ